MSKDGEATKSRIEAEFSDRSEIPDASGSKSIVRIRRLVNVRLLISLFPHGTSSMEPPVETSTSYSWQMSS